LKGKGQLSGGEEKGGPGRQINDLAGKKRTRLELPSDLLQKTAKEKKGVHRGKRGKKKTSKPQKKKGHNVRETGETMDNKRSIPPSPRLSWGINS